MSKCFLTLLKGLRLLIGQAGLSSDGGDFSLRLTTAGRTRRDDGVRTLLPLSGERRSDCLSHLRAGPDLQSPPPSPLQPGRRLLLLQDGGEGGGGEVPGGHQEDQAGGGHIQGQAGRDRA